MKHWMISAGAGAADDSLKAIRECFVNGYATKDEFQKALRAHKDAKDAMKIDQREAEFYGYVVHFDLHILSKRSKYCCCCFGIYQPLLLICQPLLLRPTLVPTLE